MLWNKFFLFVLYYFLLLIPLNAQLEFLYIESNVGGSSGGHTALRINDLVYHYQQSENEIFLIIRESWEHFYYTYNILQNRNIHICEIDAPAKAIRKIERRLNRLVIIQQKHLTILKTLAQEHYLWQALASGKKRIFIRAGGFFSWHKKNNSRTLYLKKKILKHYGKNYLSQEKSRLRQYLQSVPKVTRLSEINIGREHYPLSVNSQVEEYFDALHLYCAYDILDQGRPLSKSILKSNDNSEYLTIDEKRVLQQFALDLEQYVIELIYSRRPDRGYPLLLAIARYKVVIESLIKNRLLLLDIFPNDSIVLPSKLIQQQSALIKKIAQKSLIHYNKARKHIFTKTSINEMDYNYLENRAGQYFELTNGIATLSSIRTFPTRMIPVRPANVLLPFIPQSSLYRHYQKLVYLSLTLYLEKLQKIYPYHLIKKNCATELIKDINSCFTDVEMKYALGNKFIHGENYTYIPFVVFKAVKKNWRIYKETTIFSYRNRQLLKMYEKEAAAGVYLRECNILTSTIPHQTNNEPFFLLFTDDIYWPRPFYGVLNSGYSLLQSGLGIITLPFDSGDRVSRGWQGFMYSVPELFFCNIRKGSYHFGE